MDFAIASDMMFICLIEHMVSACIDYSNGVVQSCGDLLDIVPPLPPLAPCRRLKVVVTRTEDTSATLESNSSICVRMNNLHDG